MKEPQQGIPAEQVLRILTQRAQNDKELALHMEAAMLRAANQMQQERINDLTTDTQPEEE